MYKNKTGGGPQATPPLGTRSSDLASLYQADDHQAALRVTSFFATSLSAILAAVRLNRRLMPHPFLGCATHGSACFYYTNFAGQTKNTFPHPA